VGTLPQEIRVTGIRFFDVASADPRRRSLLYTLAFCALSLAVELWAVSSPGAYGKDLSFYLLWLLATLSGAMALLIRWWPAHGAAAAERRAEGGAPVARPRASSTHGDLEAWRMKRADVMERQLSQRRPKVQPSVVMDTPRGPRLLTFGRILARARRIEQDLWSRAEAAEPERQEGVEEPRALDDLGAWRSVRARGFSQYDMNMPSEPLPSAPKERAGGPDAARAKKEHKPVDPWARVLEEMDSRDRGAR
jgi:hypothetical protein